MKKDKTMCRLFKMIRPHIKSIFIITILAIIINIGEILKPYLVKIIIDDYLSLGIFEKGAITIATIGWIYVAIVIFGNIIDFIATTATNMLGENVIYTLRNKLFIYTQKANIPFHDRTSSGKLFVRITNDVEDVATLFKEVLATFMKDVILVIAMLLIMCVLSIKLSAVSFIVLPFVIISAYIITKALNKVHDFSKNIRTQVNTFLAETIYGLKLIKIFNRQKEKQEECEKLTKDFLDSRKQTGILEGLLPGLLLLFENLGIAIIVWACINNWFGIEVQVGLIYMFITYLKKLFEPITRIVENMEVLQESVVSINKIYDILDEEQYLEDLKRGLELTTTKGKIEFKNVWFSYDNENWILKDVSFTINPGESIAFVGKTGSGKTTITNLINRFYEIQKGEILLDGVNIKEINLKNLRKKIGIILQDPFVFAKSLKDNVALNMPLDDEIVEEALHLASADGFVSTLPNGINQIARERGNSYSSGQKQLIAFARIFAHNPDIFILDEATANIDTNTEQLIQKSIDIISSKKTSIFIAHRLSTIVNVDKIIVLDKGQIVEEGTHNELVNGGGYYARLYNSYYESLQ